MIYLDAGTTYSKIITNEKTFNETFFVGEKDNLFYYIVPSNIIKTLNITPRACCGHMAQANENEIIASLRAEFEEKEGIKVFPISAVSGKGLKELLYHVKDLLATCPKEIMVFESEFDPTILEIIDEPYTIEIDPEDGAYVVEGPKIDKMLGYTNLESEKGFLFFQRFLKEQGILEALEEQGIQEGDTVRMYGNEFDYYK